MNEQTPTGYRDEELGAALRELEVPEHAPAFFAELDRRLARSRGASAPGRWPRVRRRRVRWGLRLAAAAVVAAVAAAALAVLASERSPQIVAPEVASAAQIKAKVRTSLANLDNLSGVLASDGPERDDVARWRFALTARGDLRLAGPGEGELITYDAAAGIVRSAQRSASLGESPIFYAERRGVAPGPPDAGTPTLSHLDELGAFVRALLAADDPRVRETTYEGRPAWRLDVDAVPNAIVPELSADRFEITVDRATGMPVQVVERRRGAFLREIRIEELAVDRGLPPDTFRLAFPEGAEVMRSDGGFRSVGLDDAAGIVGYPPLVPSHVPDGYELVEVAVAQEAGATGTEGGNPPSRMVVSLSYRRGLDQLLVTTRLAAAPAGYAWSDPLATGEGFVDRPEPVVLADGALRGVRAQLVIVPRGIPHLWALADELVVTVGGDLSRAELVKVAESLARRS
jgi:hypothetical protein